MLFTTLSKAQVTSTTRLRDAYVRLVHKDHNNYV